MKKIIVIGGKGRIGSYLVPMLCEAGHKVLCVSRGQTDLYRDQAVWQSVQQVVLDRRQADFTQKIADLKGDVVIDLICFKDDDMHQMVEALRGNIGHYIVCGSLWMHGPSTIVPCPEHLNRQPIGEYGQEKLKMDDSIQRLYATAGFPGTIVHPGHIVAEGYRPVNPQGNLNLEVFSALCHGRNLALPNLGMETLHHVHAADVAGVMAAAIEAGSLSFGQGFHAASPAALTLAGYAREVAAWFGRQADLSFQPYETWAKSISDEDAAATYDHISRSPNASMEKARRMLGFTPRYTSLQAIRAAVDWLIEQGTLS
ncbi:MAG: NAD-dependent epimerase/dehydratase family protein [Bacillota bacterium]|nr:NAD-dependent epimerase/dehydratase family protein [Bacillota bacterium]